MEVKQIGNLWEDSTNFENRTSGRIYDKDGISPTINTMQGGWKQPMVIDDTQGFEDKPRLYINNAPCLRSERSGLKTIVAMRGRNPTNPSDRTPGIELEQTLEVNGNGTSNCLTSVQKDNLVLENVYDFYNDKMKQDGVCGTLTTGTSHNGSGTFGIVEGITTKGKHIDVASTILSGYERTNMTGFNADNGVVETINKVGQISNDGSQYGAVIADNGLSPNLVAGTHGYANSCIATQYRIRKLTPRECWRLMDFSDEDFEKAAEVNSNTQLYKQAGNSIVVNVLVAILGQLLPGKENVYKELSECE